MQVPLAWTEFMLGNWQWCFQKAAHTISTVTKHNHFNCNQTWAIQASHLSWNCKNVVKLSWNFEFFTSRKFVLGGWEAWQPIHWFVHLVLISVNTLKFIISLNHTWRPWTECTPTSLRVPLQLLHFDCNIAVELRLPDECIVCNMLSCS